MKLTTYFALEAATRAAISSILLLLKDLNIIKTKIPT